MTRHPARSLLVGALFGATLSVLRFSSWDAVHAALTFSDPRLLLTVVLAIALVGSLWMGLSRSDESALEPHVGRGVVRGAVLFGAGLAITGTPPALAFVALGEGKLGALAILAGVVLGNLLVARVQPTPSVERRRRARSATSTSVPLHGSH